MQDFVSLLPSKIVTYQSGHDVPDGYKSNNAQGASLLEDTLDSSAGIQGRKVVSRCTTTCTRYAYNLQVDTSCTTTYMWYAYTHTCKHVRTHIFAQIPFKLCNGMMHICI